MDLTSSNPSHVRKWLSQHHPKQLKLLSKFEMELRLGRLSTSSTFSARNVSSAQAEDPNSNPPGSATNTSSFRDGCSSNIGGQDRRLVTKRTVELLRTLIGSTKWKTASELLMLLRGLGRELYSAGGFREPAIGNVVRRVMCAVRDEAVAIGGSKNENDDQKDEKDYDDIHLLEKEFDTKVSFKEGTRFGSMTSSTASAKNSHVSLSTMLWTHTQHISASSSFASKAAERVRENTLDKMGMRHRSDSVASNNSKKEMNTDDDDDYEDNYLMNLPPSFFVVRNELKERVMEAIQETVSELDDLHKNIDEQAINHIHAGEIILCYGRSKTIEYFLKAAAAKNRSFHVIIAEGAPHFSGHAMAKSLAQGSKPIPTTVIHDAATFAIMARVNKVLLPAHAVLANGGLVAPSGCHMVALAAKENSVPVVCITGMFKLCPMFPHEGQDTLNDLVSPCSVMGYGEVPYMSMSNNDVVDDLDDNDQGLEGMPNADAVQYEEKKSEDDTSYEHCEMEEVELINPVHDYIPPDLIKLYITNIGGFQPSYIYKLLAEYYHTDDWESFE